MPSPFPGMDPYIERPVIWPDFHNHLITAIKAALQPLLRPRYVALSEDRLFVVESDRPIRPDLALVRTSSPKPPAGAATAVMELDAPAVFELWREEIRQPLIQILEPAAGNRVVTAIEVLSPDNKAAGEGRDSYLQKREEYWAAGTNLVEIDLLRVGQPTVRVSAENMATLRPWRYLVAVTRRWPSRRKFTRFRCHAGCRGSPCRWRWTTVTYLSTSTPLSRAAGTKGRTPNCCATKGRHRGRSRRMKCVGVRTCCARPGYDRRRRDRTPFEDLNGRLQNYPTRLP